MAGDIAVPFALPGERVEAAVTGRKGRLLTVEEPAASRAAPPCRHFGLPGEGCGGCKLQHLAEADYRAFKLSQLTGALARAGVRHPAPEAVWSGPRERRRAKLVFVRTEEGVRAGFRALMSDRVVPLAECHLLAPALFEAALALPPLMTAFPWRGVAEAMLTLTDTGLDVDVSGVDEAKLSMEARVAAARIAERLDLARLAVGGAPLAERRTPALRLGGVPAALPPGAFLQATERGQMALTDAVLSACEGAARVADLFCGVGTFALPLSAQASVHAAEAEGPAIAALTAAARRAGRPVEAEARDLYTRPLLAEELSRFDAVALDPPRAGAAAQVAELARSAVPVIAYVSCAPAALARDAAMLSACYHLTGLTLVDQFLWSPHIEAVAVFRRRA